MLIEYVTMVVLVHQDQLFSFVIDHLILLRFRSTKLTTNQRVTMWCTTVARHPANLNLHVSNIYRRKKLCSFNTKESKKQ